LCRCEAVLKIGERIEKIVMDLDAVELCVEFNSLARKAFTEHTGRKMGFRLPYPVAMAWGSLDESIVMASSEHFWD